jgi:UDP-N-acetylmuramyl pentapeptide phosphotransferase/UDP-N-acetylglucosamine-1-phosphate transferase
MRPILVPNIIAILQVILVLPLSYLLTRLTIILAKKVNFVSHPNPIVESHKKPIAFGGGVAIGLSLIIFLLINAVIFKYSELFIIILLSVMAAGLMDDIYKLSPVKKLLLQAVASLPFLIFFTNASAFMLFIYLLIILTAQNSWNLIDIMDGLLTGIATVIFLSAGVIISGIAGLLHLSELSFAIAFSLLGFWFLNKSPAKIFLGETGSLLLGSFYAYLVIMTSQINMVTAGFLLLLGSIPFFELIFLIIERTSKGIPFYQGSPDHFALRMLHNGFTVPAINKKVIIICAFYSSITVLLSLISNHYFTLGICLLFDLIFGVIGFYYFNSLPAREMPK